MDQLGKAEGEPERAEPARASAEQSGSDVVKTIPTIIRTEEAAAESVPDALADTHTDLESSGPRSKPQRGPNPSMLRSKRPLLASTLRMELTVRRNEGSEPEISVRPSPSFTDGEDPGSSGYPDAHAGSTTLSESAPRSRKPTAAGGYGGYSPSFEDIPAPPRERSTAARGGAAERPQPVLDETVRRGSDISSDSVPNMNTQRPRRPRRPGERTLIMTRRDPKRSSKRDWLFVVMLVAALGLTASMFLSRQTPAESEEVVDASEYEDPQDEQQPDPFATTLQPYKAKPAARADRPAQPAQTESSISASTIQATELRSLPSGAEVVAGDAVVGSTPVRVAAGYSIGGVAKGSGMVHPDMATVFGFFTTDANIAPARLQHLLRQAADVSFNMIDVDMDTSTSDTMLLFANAAAGGGTIAADSPEEAQFARALTALATELARDLARDGEGAKTLIEMEVVGARTLEDARRAARTVVSSPLIKTMVTGRDPNLGRVMMALGRSGAELSEERISVWIGGQCAFERGAPTQLDYAAISRAMDAPEVKLKADLGLGDHAAKAWGCDLTAEYVSINADYTT